MKTENKILAPLPFSVEQLNKIGNNDEAFTNSMLEKFVPLALECSNDLWSALNKSDWYKLKLICHKHIPSYYQLELDEIGGLLEFIEKNAEEHPEKITEAVESIFIKNNEVVKSINEYLATKQSDRLEEV